MEFPVSIWDLLASKTEIWLLVSMTNSILTRLSKYVFMITVALEVTVDWCVVHYNKGSIEVIRLDVSTADWPEICASLSLSSFLHFHWQSEEEVPSLCLNHLQLLPHRLDFQPTSWQPETSQSPRTTGSTWTKSDWSVMLLIILYNAIVVSPLDLDFSISFCNGLQSS